ncbi:GIY-YIG nuclease family protein [[Kitasatospora] papulosa]|uniref:GIY-YIG nuclease family protein n=1 Tax=[Kitasatospora] papulosa TaxID=1464011 RepID=UPI0036986BE0
MTVPGLQAKLIEGIANPSLMAHKHLSTQAPNPPATAVYRFFDSADQLLYVGITSRLSIRWKEHARDYTFTWWPKVRSSSVTWYPDRSRAASAEREAIRTENPQFNVLHASNYLGRAGKYKPTGPFPPGRGAKLLPLIRKTYGDKHFSRADLLAVAGGSSSAMIKNVRALVQQHALIAVGTRRVIGSLGNWHTLYVTADSPLASQPTFHEVVSASGVAESIRTPRSRTSAQRDTPRRVHLKSSRLLEMASEAFKDEPFTRADLARLVGRRRDCVTRAVRFLIKQGLLVEVGKAGQRPPGVVGPPGVLLQIVRPAIPAQRPRTTASARSVILRTAGVTA